MTRNNAIWLEGFCAAISCSGTTGCDYRRDSDAWEIWWNGFKEAKNLDTRDAVQKYLLKYRKAAA